MLYLLIACYWNPNFLGCKTWTTPYPYYRSIEGCEQTARSLVPSTQPWLKIYCRPYGAHITNCEVGQRCPDPWKGQEIE
jgi:hypothetical protein